MSPFICFFHVSRASRLFVSASGHAAVLPSLCLVYTLFVLCVARLCPRVSPIPPRFNRQNRKRRRFDSCSLSLSSKDTSLFLSPFHPLFIPFSSHSFFFPLSFAPAARRLLIEMFLLRDTHVCSGSCRGVVGIAKRVISDAKDTR